MPSNEPTSSDTAQRAAQVRATDGPNVVGAVLLITLGLLFLLSNYGYLPWSTWAMLWRLWPLFLIILGVQLLLGRSLIARWTTALLALLILGSAVSFAVGSVHEPMRTWMHEKLGITVRNLDELSERTTSTLAILNTKYPEVTARTLTAEFGAAELRVTEADSADLLSVRATHPKSAGRPVLTEHVRGNTLLLNLSTRNDAGFWAMSPVERSYDITLGTPKLPTDMQLELGAGKATLSLAETPLSSLEINVGAGSADATLGTIALPSELTLDVGAGNIRLTVPKETKFTVKHDVGAGRIVLDGETLSRNGQYIAGGTGKAVTVNAHVGAGTITIDRQ